MSCEEYPATPMVGYNGVEYFQCRNTRKTVHVYNTDTDKLHSQLVEACCA